MILDHALRSIRERNREHFASNPVSTDQNANEIRTLLEYIDELESNQFTWDDCEE